MKVLISLHADDYDIAFRNSLSIYFPQTDFDICPEFRHLISLNAMSIFESCIISPSCGDTCNLRRYFPVCCVSTTSQNFTILIIRHQQQPRSHLSSF